MDKQTPATAKHPPQNPHAGTGHWWHQRVTAVALLPLTLWAVKFITLTQHAPYPETLSWLQQPLNSACIVAWILAVFYHAALGLQVVIEDYIAVQGQKIIALWATNLAFLFIALAALLAVFRVLSIG